MFALRRNDVAFLDALGARAIPDPTTSDDLCRRFRSTDTHLLMDITMTPSALIDSTGSML
jgi:hypothetical protein